ncbi:uncharacterized protein [Henckelia pumila]|uniref:uncharacterized protein n=1 Tax=Henckelia pumila TaxID=405737 RepID=UPI003C6E5E3E
MNSQVSSPLFPASSSSSSNGDLDDYIDNYVKEEHLIAQQIHNNNIILCESVRHQNANITHGGSIPGRRTIYCIYFVQRRNAAGKLSLTTLQKVTAAFRILAYALPADANDEYIKIGESTAIEYVKRFCRAIVEIFKGQYLRSPTANDIARLLHIGEQRGFPGMLGSLYCMHWRWKICPTAWAEQYAGRSGSPTIILEVVADYDLWIWHAYFGMPGSNNDINVLETSHLFSDLTRGIAPPAHFVQKRIEYNMGYYLSDNIYPKWSTLVQTIHDPRAPKKNILQQNKKRVEKMLNVHSEFFKVVSQWWQTQHVFGAKVICMI